MKFSFCFMVLLLISCRVTSTGKALCPIEDLLVEASDLPGNQWEEAGSRSYRDTPSRLGTERIGTGFSTPFSGVAEENVYRFWNETDANDGYFELADLWHRLEPEGTTWSQLDMPSDIVISANDYRLECSISSHQNVRTCWYIARYEKTVIEFRVAMIIVKEKDLFKIIDTLDQKAMTCEKS